MPAPVIAPRRPCSGYEAMRLRMVARMFARQIAAKDEREPRPAPEIPAYARQPAEVE